MRTFYDRVEGVDVWVTAERPLVREETGYVEAKFFQVAFKFGVEPGPIVGEYLRDRDGLLRGFDSEIAAFDAGFSEATRRIRAQRKPK